MEITMYEDNTFNNPKSKESIDQMKRKFTLNLNGCATKKMRLQNSLLTSPDISKFKLASPELEKFLTSNGNLLSQGFNFPTPTSLKLPTPSTVSKEEFVSEFQETLNQYHMNSTIEGPTVVSSEPSMNIQYTQLEPPQTMPTQQQVPVTSSFVEDQNCVWIKEEPQTVPNGTPPLSPIDMENQEKIKLERKRLRNRIAASKCRKRKLERISKLEDKVEALKAENSELQTVVNRMKEEVCALKQEVMVHVNSGCEIPFLSSQVMQ